MTNKHVELIKKWIDDNNNGVNFKKLKEDSDAAWVAAAAATAKADAADARAVEAAEAATAATWAAIDADDTAKAAADTAAYVRDAKRWVQEYEEADDE